MSVIRPCNVCGHPLEEKCLWPEDMALEWVADCLRWRGEVLHGDHIHWCVCWDGLPVDETTREYDCCDCLWKDDP